MQNQSILKFSPTRLKQIKKIALLGSKSKLKILNGKFEEGFHLLKSTAQKFKSFATDLADSIPQSLAIRISLDLFSHFEAKSSKRLGIPKGIVLGGILGLMSSLPAVGQDIFVTSTVDGNANALRQAILDANASGIDNRILLPSGSLNLLTIGGLPIVTGTDIGGTLEIICTGSINAIIDGDNLYRPLTMTIGSDLTISKITVQNGIALKGGGIYNKRGDLTISNSIITNNEVTGGGVDGRGAGIYSTGDLVAASVLIQNSTISLNSASGDGGGIFNRNSSPVVISYSSVSGNTSLGSAGGGGIFNTASPLTISTSTISVCSI